MKSSDEKGTQGLAEKVITEEELVELRKKSEELQKKENIMLSDIYFAFDDFSLSEESENTLRELAAWFRNNPEKKVIIEGYTDERGTEEYNIALSERRAKSVKHYLVTLGIKPRQLTAIGRGEKVPAGLTISEEVPAGKNRRARLIIHDDDS